MANIPSVATRICIREPNEGKIREAYFIISETRKNGSWIRVMIDQSPLFDLKRDEAFRIIPRLSKLPVSEWESFLQNSEDKGRMALEKLNSTAINMAASLLMNVANDVYPYLELEPISLGTVSLSDAESLNDSEKLEGQTTNFLSKRYFGGLVYSSTGYETYFLNLPAVSTVCMNSGISMDQLFQSLIALYETSLLGAIESLWGQERIFSNYFIPIHIPASASDQLSPATRKVWEIIRRMR